MLPPNGYHSVHKVLWQTAYSVKSVAPGVQPALPPSQNKFYQSEVHFCWYGMYVRALTVEVHSHA